MRLTLHRWIVVGIALISLPATWWAGARADEAALRAAGFEAERDSVPQRYFALRAREGLPPPAVARQMPPGAIVTRYIVPVAGGPDSVLLERYVYRAALIGRWPVQIYYQRGGGVKDVFAQDQWPSLDGAREVSAAEAERWHTGSESPATFHQLDP